MATNRKTTPDDPVKAIGKLIDKIRKELSCTKAEAYFSLRFIDRPEDEAVYWDTTQPEEFDGNPPQPTLEWTLTHTRRILKGLEECRTDVDNGKISGVFEAVNICGELGFPLPTWAKERLDKAWNSYNWHIAKTLDDAFKVKRPRNYPHKKASEAANLSFNVYWRCKTLHDKGVKIGGVNADLFEEVAKEFDMTRTKVSDYYYFWKNNLSASDPFPGDVPETIKPLLQPRTRKKRKPE